jgi:RNA polymerase-associated protein
MSETPLFKRSSMTLFSDPSCPDSHRVRMLSAEKDIVIDIVDVDPRELPEDLMMINPTGSLPTLVDRELVLADSQVIMEYLDERYPHPPLMPVDPVDRARARMVMHRLKDEWYPQLAILSSSETRSKDKHEARKQLRDSLIQMVPVFEHQPYFMSQDYSIVDISLAVLIWRLEEYGIELPEKAAAVITDYSDKLFAKRAFKKSLSEIEEDMR